MSTTNVNTTPAIWSVNTTYLDDDLAMNNSSNKTDVVWLPPYNLPLTIIIHTINMLGACGGNILVIFTIMRFKYLRTGTNFLIAALTFFDLLVGVTNVTRILQVVWPEARSIPSICIFQLHFIAYGPLASMFCILGISCDRYLAVMYPYIYQAWVTMTRSCLFIFIICLYPFLFLLLMTANNVYEEGQPCEYYFVYTPLWSALFSGHLSILLIGTAILNGRIVWLAAQHRRRIAALEVASRENEAEESRQMGKNAHIIKVFSLVGGIYFFTVYLPFIIVGNMAVVDPWAALENSALRGGQLLVGFGVVFNSAANPVIYAFSYGPIKKGFKQLFCCSAGDASEE